MSGAPNDFAGFTKDEWLSAWRLTGSEDDARDYVEFLFTQLEVEPSNGFMLTEETYALLSCVNDDCRRRVEDLLKNASPDFVRRVHSIASEVRNSAAPGT